MESPIWALAHEAAKRLLVGHPQVDILQAHQLVCQAHSNHESTGCDAYVQLAFASSGHGGGSSFGLITLDAGGRVNVLELKFEAKQSYLELKSRNVTEIPAHPPKDKLFVKTMGTLYSLGGIGLAQTGELMSKANWEELGESL